MIASENLNDEAIIRLYEGIFAQLSKDYIKHYAIFKEYPKGLESYIREHPLTCSKADYIIKNLRALAVQKGKVKRKTNRANRR